ncbi:ArsR/SmtB family transcription factor [Skermanella pratensis]|uniref:ArsR/SmtB family transcription factor n=1 Tax=Skermanella pratensis TaxID=2233999 RepID=UPI001B3B9ECE|nr:metalloregulator ArsR/SmtB family transcription factor [Skermanella pratensis]
MVEPNGSPMNPAELEAQAAEAESFLRSLASRQRLMILCSLAEGEMQAGELVRRLGRSQSNVSQHPAKLREEDPVATRREGAAIHYRIASDRIRPTLAELHRLFRAESRPG